MYLSAQFFDYNPYFAAAASLLSPNRVHNLWIRRLPRRAGFVQHTRHSAQELVDYQQLMLEEAASKTRIAERQIAFGH